MNTSWAWKKHWRYQRNPDSAEIKDLKTSQAEIKNAVTEIQNRLDITTTGTEEAEERIGDIEGKITENKLKRRVKEKLGYEGRVRELSDSIKWNNIRVIGIPEAEEQERGAEHLF